MIFHLDETFSKEILCAYIDLLLPGAVLALEVLDIGDEADRIRGAGCVH